MLTDGAIACAVASTQQYSSCRRDRSSNIDCLKQSKLQDSCAPVPINVATDCLKQSMIYGRRLCFAVMFLLLWANQAALNWMFGVFP
jgi:hypothetical protein